MSCVTGKQKLQFLRKTFFSKKICFKFSFLHIFQDFVFSTEIYFLKKKCFSILFWGGMPQTIKFAGIQVLFIIGEDMFVDRCRCCR